MFRCMRAARELISIVAVEKERRKEPHGECSGLHTRAGAPDVKCPTCSILYVLRLNGFMKSIEYQIALWTNGTLELRVHFFFYHFH